MICGWVPKVTEHRGTIQYKVTSSIRVSHYVLVLLFVTVQV